MAVSDSSNAGLRAILIAPWAVVPIIALALKGGPHLSRLELFVSGLFVGTLFAVPLAYLAVLLVGYPAYRLLKSTGSLNGWTLCAVGMTLGVVGGFVFAGTEAIALCGISGLAVAFTAWRLLSAPG